MISPDDQLERLLKVLVDRFGSARTLGEVYATTYALRAYREGKDISLADIASHTGVSKQNLSRWLKVHIETHHVNALPDRADGRMNVLQITNLDYAARHLPLVANVLDCRLDPARVARVKRAVGERSDDPDSPIAPES